MTEAVARVRRFNRFYTRRLGLLDRGLLDSEFSLPEVRVMYEVAHRKDPTAGEIGTDLGLDAGYLSRILQALRRRGLVRAVAAKGDRRQRLLSLTERGRAAFRQLDARSAAQVRGLLNPLATEDAHRLVDAMASIERLLGEDKARRGAGVVAFRGPEPGDLGWVVERHGVLYAAEYGWNQEFEVLVAGIVGEFAVAESGPGARQRCWIATLDGVRAGCVFLMPASEQVAKLRMLLVEPWARGHGIGEQLVEACIAAAREAGYRRMTLWTNSLLHAARKLYERAGFQLVKSEAHHSWGHALVGQTWERGL
jgi:DNA-binding MarR family transcriptional regulator/N-acetylglutamate synthase-like GNAT family acetyltransferase